VSEHAELTHFEPLARACKALSHPARLTILQVLARRGTCICGELVEVLPLSQATVSQAAARSARRGVPLNRTLLLNRRHA
jgi:ArsR family transcriptional regulator